MKIKKCNYDCFNCKHDDCIKVGYIKPVPIPTKNGYFNDRQLKQLKTESKYRPQPASR